MSGRLLTNSPPSPLNPQEPARGSHEITLTREIYIERNDFRKEPTKGYYGLVPGKEVTRRPSPCTLCTTHTHPPTRHLPGQAGLKYVGNILCTGFEVNKAGVVTHVKVTVDRERTNKVKGHLTWVAGDGPGVEPTRAEVRWLVGW